MAVISDYLDWRGDVPFSVSPLNDVDRYLLAVLNTPDWTGAVPENGTYVSIEQAVDAYFALGGAEDLGISASRTIVSIIRRLPKTARFSPLLLTGFRKRSSAEEQFCALTVRLPDGRHYVGYRGTDDTLPAWREDCMLAVLDAVPAQKSAVEYLTWAADTYPGDLLVGGHSKGGNLALYAAAMADGAVQDRLTSIDNFDGPGFGKQFFASEGFQRIAGRVQSILSENAMVGTLFRMETELTVVKTKIFGVMAHDGLNWETDAHGFVPAEGLSPAARAFNEAMDRVLAEMDTEERREFVEVLFDTLEATGAKTLTELTEQNIRRVISTGHTLNGKEEVRRILREILENTAKCYVSEKASEIHLPDLSRLPKLRKLRVPTQKRKK